MYGCYLLKTKEKCKPTGQPVDEEGREGDNRTFNKKMKLAVRLLHKMKCHKSNIVSVDSNVCSEFSLDKIKCEA